jgi:putative endonuclease
VYIMSSKSRVLYTGITNNLRKRVFQHKNDVVECFTQRYKIHRLVYYEVFRDVRNAISREKQIKSWTRAKRVAIISKENPTWEDLAVELFN